MKLGFICINALGTKEGGMLGDRGAPIMADYHRCFLVDGIK
jgi:hypothetical protein